MSVESEPFRARTVAIIAVALAVGLLAFLVLAAFQPQMRSGQDGRAHALSGSAVGFRGVYQLLEETGADTEYIRDRGSIYGPGIVIATIGMENDEERLEELFERGRTQPVLIILPKWLTAPSPDGADRVAEIGPTLGSLSAAFLPQIDKLRVRVSDIAADTRLTGALGGGSFVAPAHLQTIDGGNLEGLLQNPAGDAVLARLRDTQTYILAEPDLINNMALASPDRARAALRLLGRLNADQGPYRFDMVLNGYGGQRNLLTLAFEPPFLALTLCILAAALLAGLQAAFRFGPPQSEPRAIAFGKRALVDNSAELLRLARREHLSSARYAELTREAAVAAIGNPRNLEGEALDRWLDEFRPEGERFTTLAAAAETARSRHDILSAARALHNWRKAVTHEG